MWQFLSPGKSIKWYLPGLTMGQSFSSVTGILLYIIILTRFNYVTVFKSWNTVHNLLLILYRHCASKSIGIDKITVESWKTEQYLVGYHIDDLCSGTRKLYHSLSHNPNFKRPLKTKLLNTSWEKEKMLVLQHFLLFPQFILLFLKQGSIFVSYLFCCLSFWTGLKCCHLPFGKGLIFSQMAIFSSSKLKEFADYNLKFDRNGRKFSERKENTKGKGKIAGYTHFPHLTIDLCCRHVKTRACLGKS